MKNIAVVLSGCGFLDGAEIRESVATLWALSPAESQGKISVQCFAPDIPQNDVMNTHTQQPAEGETRNVLVESARITRSKSAPLSELNPQNFDAVIFPGGFGVAKTFCTFASQGSQAFILPEVESILQKFHQSGKPIGALCIAPALLALALKGASLELTVGADGEAAQEIEKLGHRHVVCQPNEHHIDSQNKVVSTPAYMYDDAPLHEIFEGIQKTVQDVIRLA